MWHHTTYLSTAVIFSPALGWGRPQSDGPPRNIPPPAVPGVFQTVPGRYSSLVGIESPPCLCWPGRGTCCVGPVRNIKEIVG